jgi:hypothetical protein
MVSARETKRGRLKADICTVTPILGAIVCATFTEIPVLILILFEPKLIVCFPLDR